MQVSVLDPFKPYLNDRLAQGVRNTTRLLAEITGQGYTGGYNTLARYLRPLRRIDAAALAELPPRPAPPAARRSPGGSPASPATSTRATLSDYRRSGPAALRWTPPSGTWPGSPG